MISSAEYRLTPVRLPSGLLKLLTRPNLTGSLPLENTMGTDVVAAFAANPAAGLPVATITAT